MNHAVLHSGVQRGPRLVCSEERLLCRPIFFFLTPFYMIWHNYVNNGSFCFFVVVFLFVLLFFLFYLFIYFCFYKSLAFPCVVLQFYI